MAYLLGLIAGLASPTQTSVNSKLREKIGSPYIATVISFGISFTISTVILLFVDHGFHLPLFDVAQEPIWIWLGGLCGTGIVALNIVCMPKLGSAWTAMLLCFGQIISGLFIDHFGLFKSDVIPSSFSRIIGAIVVIAGVFMVSKDNVDKKQKLPILYVALATMSGLLYTTQIAINGRLTTVTGLCWRSTFISMAFGMSGSILLLVVMLIIKGRKGIFEKIDKNLKFKWYMFTGGFCAATIVGCNAIIAPIIGAGMSTLMNLLAQMAGGLLYDAVGFLGIEKKAITKNKVIGMVSMIFGTVIITFI